MKRSLACQIAKWISRKGERPFSAMPSMVSPETGKTEVLQLSYDAPLLVSTPDRLWGANAILPDSILPRGRDAQRIAVVRDAFAGALVSPRPLSELVATLGNGSIAVASELAQNHRRLIVDEYRKEGDGRYALQAVATDIYRFFSREGLRVCHVPNVQGAKHAQYNSARSASCRGPRQSTNEVLMVAPTAFGFNPQAAQDNSFMHSSTSAAGSDTPDDALLPSQVTAKVLEEYSGLYRELSEVAGVKVNLFQHDRAHGTPDAVFPNNWFSTHPAGEAAGGTRESTLVFYPMKCPNRALERRIDIQGVLHSRGYGKVLDLSRAEQEDRFFEGTGSLVLDRINGIAYVSLSERADKAIAEHWVQKLGYRELITFRSSDSQGSSVYHTNVMMAIGTDVAVVCLESVTDAAERQRLKDSLSAHHAVIDISQHQMAALCGNVLELEDGRNLPVMAMSTKAYNAFTLDQRKVLRRHVAELHHAPIDTLEHIGGGGVRCALAELFS